MLLGLSGDDNADSLVGELDVSVVAGADFGAGAGGDGGVAHGALLTRYAEAVHAEADDLAEVRQLVAEALGEAGMVDAAAVCANFNMMVRIADGTGTPLDTGTAQISADLRAQLGLDDLASQRIAQS